MVNQDGRLFRLTIADRRRSVYTDGPADVQVGDLALVVAADGSTCDCIIVHEEGGKLTGIPGRRFRVYGLLEKPDLRRLSLLEIQALKSGETVGEADASLLLSERVEALETALARVISRVTELEARPAAAG